MFVRPGTLKDGIEVAPQSVAVRAFGRGEFVQCVRIPKACKVGVVSQMQERVKDRSSIRRKSACIAALRPMMRETKAALPRRRQLAEMLHGRRTLPRLGYKPVTCWSQPRLP